MIKRIPSICMQWQIKIPMYNLIFSLHLDTEIPLKVWINLSARIFFVFQTSAQAGSGAAWTRLLGFILAKSTQDGIQISFGAKSFNFNFKRCLTSWLQKWTAYSSMEKSKTIGTSKMSYMIFVIFSPWTTFLAQFVST